MIEKKWSQEPQLMYQHHSWRQPIEHTCSRLYNHYLNSLHEQHNAGCSSCVNEELCHGLWRCMVVLLLLLLLLLRLMICCICAAT
jgi:hypothetical protein